MDMAIIFMIVASVAPFLSIHIRKYWFAGIQILLLIGMWIYFIESLGSTAVPGNFSILWFSFYASLVVSEIAYVMFAIYVVKKIQEEIKSIKAKSESDDPMTEI